MPASCFAGGSAAQNLVDLVKAHFRCRGERPHFAPEVDVIIDEARVVVAGMVYLTKTDRSAQARASQAAGKLDPRRTRILVPQTLIIESVSPGHEQHDHRTKRKWYAEFGVPNHWIVDAFEHSMQCLALHRKRYIVDAAGKQNQKLRPTSFPGLVIPLAELWDVEE